jgi:hypothetical protein
MMKNLTFIFVLILFSCKKETQNFRCAPLPVDFVGTWKWEQINNGSSWIDLQMGVLQEIEITETEIIYSNFNQMNGSYQKMECSVVSSFCGTQNVYVSIIGDTMILTGLNDNTRWKLSKTYIVQ